MKIPIIGNGLTSPKGDDQPKDVVALNTEALHMVWYAPVNIYNERKNFLIDTGASISVIDWQVCQALQCPLPKVSQGKMRLNLNVMELHTFH
jgi:hypothetical protein